MTVSSAASAASPRELHVGERESCGLWLACCATRKPKSSQHSTAQTTTKPAKHYSNNYQACHVAFAWGVGRAALAALLPALLHRRV